MPSLSPQSSSLSLDIADRFNRSLSAYRHSYAHPQTPRIRSRSRLVNRNQVLWMVGLSAAVLLLISIPSAKRLQ